MFRLTTLLRLLAGSLGNAGAVANVRSALEARDREEWVVDGLLRRLGPDPALPAVPPAAPAAEAA